MALPPDGSGAWLALSEPPALLGGLWKSPLGSVLIGLLVPVWCSPGGLCCRVHFCVVRRSLRLRSLRPRPILPLRGVRPGSAPMVPLDAWGGVPGCLCPPPFSLCLRPRGSPPAFLPADRCGGGRAGACRWWGRVCARVGCWFMRACLVVRFLLVGCSHTRVCALMSSCAYAFTPKFIYARVPAATCHACLLSCSQSHVRMPARCRTIDCSHILSLLRTCLHARVRARILLGCRVLYIAHLALVPAAPRHWAVLPWCWATVSLSMALVPESPTGGSAAASLPPVGWNGVRLSMGSRPRWVTPLLPSPSLLHTLTFPRSLLGCRFLCPRSGPDRSYLLAPAPRAMSTTWAVGGRAATTLPFPGWVVGPGTYGSAPPGGWYPPLSLLLPLTPFSSPLVSVPIPVNLPGCRVLCPRSGPDRSFLLAPAPLSYVAVLGGWWARCHHPPLLGLGCWPGYLRGRAPGWVVPPPLSHFPSPSSLHLFFPHGLLGCWVYAPALVPTAPFSWHPCP